MKILFLGDIMGRSGREALVKHLPAIRNAHNPDFIVANGENAAAGYGITQKIAAELVELGVDVITTGNHAFDQKELLTSIDGEPRILRPANYPAGTPGKGHYVATNKAGKKLLVINTMGRLFMDAMDDPFAVTAGLVEQTPLGKVDGILVDIHAEASSEKQAIAHYLDGRVSVVIGTHTHVPSADARILPGGTAYQTDAGMCGDYDSVIGMKKELSVAKMTRKYSFERLSPAEGEGSLCGAVITTNDKGLATSITSFQKGGVFG